jgi:beta-lactamase regulating signal transducer with metallopeptidase domain
MSDAVLALLLRQSLLLCAAIVMLSALRPLLLKRLGAGATYAAWLFVPARLLTPALPRPAQEPLLVVLQATTGTARVAALPALPAPPRSQATAWLVLWLAGTAGAAALQTRRQWRLTGRGERLPAGSSPALVGLLRPRVALPVDFEQRFTPAERELILAHEQVHRDRLDNLWNLLACALTALHWWNPLAWWAQRRFRNDQEIACDAAVLAARPGMRATYTRALLAAHGLVAHDAPLASRWGPTHPLVERIAMLNRPPQLTRRRAGLMALLMAGMAGLGYAAQTAPTPGAAEGPYIRLSLALAFQQGDTVRRSITSWTGRRGESMRLAIRPQAQEPAITVSLKPTRLEDKTFGLDVSFEGLPANIDARDVQFANSWGDAGVIERFGTGMSSRLTVFVVGTRVAAPAPQP